MLIRFVELIPPESTLLRIHIKEIDDNSLRILALLVTNDRIMPSPSYDTSYVKSFREICCSWRPEYRTALDNICNSLPCL